MSETPEPRLWQRAVWSALAPAEYAAFKRREQRHTRNGQRERVASRSPRVSFLKQASRYCRLGSELSRRRAKRPRLFVFVGARLKLNLRHRLLWHAFRPDVYAMWISNAPLADKIAYQVLGPHLYALRVWRRARRVTAASKPTRPNSTTTAKRGKRATAAKASAQSGIGAETPAQSAPSSARRGAKQKAPTPAVVRAIRAGGRATARWAGWTGPRLIAAARLGGHAVQQLGSVFVISQVRVRSYVRRDGTRVRSHSQRRRIRAR